MIDKIITLKNEEKYYIFLDKTFENDKFYIGVKLLDEKLTNDFKVFLENKKNDEVFFELIEDEKLLKVIVNSYVLDNI